MCTTINKLCDEVFVEVFQYIPPVERLMLRKVSWRWKNLVDDSWRDCRLLETVIYAKDYYKNASILKTEDFNKLIPILGPSIRNVSLVHSMDRNDLCSDCSKIIKFGFHVYKTELSFLKILCELESHCQKVDTLYLKCSHEDVGCHGLTLREFTRLSYLIKKFRKVTITCDWLCSYHMHFLIGYQASLKSLDIIRLHSDVRSKNLHDLEELRIEEVYDTESLLQIMEHSPELKVFSCGMFADDDGEFDCDVLQKVSTLVDLEELGLKCFEECLTDDVLLFIGKSCTKIKKFILKGSRSRITYEGLNSLKSHWTELKSLELSYNNHIRSIPMLGSLEELKIESCNEITEQALFEACKSLPRLKKLALVYWKGDNTRHFYVGNLVNSVISLTISREQNFHLHSEHEKYTIETIVSHKTDVPKFIMFCKVLHHNFFKESFDFVVKNFPGCKISFKKSYFQHPYLLRL